MADTVIIVPCYNEAERLDTALFEQFVETQSGVDFLFVNDGSRDATLEVLERLHDLYPRRFSFLHLARNSGKAEAVRQGCLLALQSHPAYLGYWDADLATPLDEIPRFVSVLNRHASIDLALGARLPLLGRRIERRPVRRVLGRLFARTASFALGMPIYDTQCGAKLFRVSPIVQQALTEPFCTRWIFDVEILARLRQTRRAVGVSPLERAVYEVTLDRWQDVAGSKLKRSDFVKAFVELVKIYSRYLRAGANWTPPAVVFSPAERKKAA